MNGLVGSMINILCSICDQVVAKCKLLLAMAPFNQVKPASPVTASAAIHPGLRKNLGTSASLLKYACYVIIIYVLN